MKCILVFLPSALLLFGCSQNRSPSASPAIDHVEAGHDVTWHDGFVLHIAKRSGVAIEGIRITKTVPDGRKKIITADTGTISPGSSENASDGNSVTFVLHKAHINNEENRSLMDADQITIVLQK